MLGDAERMSVGLGTTPAEPRATDVFKAAGERIGTATALAAPMSRATTWRLNTLLSCSWGDQKRNHKKYQSKNNKYKT